MTTTRDSSWRARPARPRVIDGAIAEPPPWLGRLLGDTIPERRRLDGIALETIERSEHVLVEARVDGAATLSPRAFVRRVEAVYGMLRERLGPLHPLRFWNFVPGIHRPAHEGMDFYEAFNGGRFAAFDTWYGRERFAERMVAATGVGHRGDALIVQALAGRTPPTESVENPRQVAAWRYSRRYGPRPPCFARATRVRGLDPSRPDGEVLILAGTASVVGEDSRHDALERQVEETCVNLRRLLATAGTTLEHLRELRAYRVEGLSRERLVVALTARLPALESLEIVDADLCRRDLLVEVEGVVPL